MRLLKYYYLNIFEKDYWILDKYEKCSKWYSYTFIMLVAILTSSYLLYLLPL